MYNTSTTLQLYFVFLLMAYSILLLHFDVYGMSVPLCPCSERVYMVQMSVLAAVGGEGIQGAARGLRGGCARAGGGRAPGGVQCGARRAARSKLGEEDRMFTRGYSRRLYLARAGQTYRHSPRPRCSALPRPVPPCPALRGALQYRGRL